MRTAPLLTILLSSAIAMSLSACGGDDDDQATIPVPVTPVTPPAMEAGDTVVLTLSNKIQSFNIDAPGTIRSTATITGMQANESMVGIDYRPADGQLYGLGSNGRLYVINPSTGVATFKSTLAADAADTTAPFTTLNGTDFGVDFNPAADRLRVVSNTGQSLRINVDSGATTTDGNINGGPAGTTITAAAYTNSFAGTGSTTLFVIDSNSGTLFTQNPPNNGTLSVPVSVGATGYVGGFDIDGRSNKAYAIMTIDGKRNLYAVNLAATANAATLVTTLGITEEIKGLALRAPSAPLVYGLTEAGRLVSFKPTTPNTFASDVAISGLVTGERLLGIDVRPKDGLLYGITSSGRIMTIDPVTGAGTLKSTLAADVADVTVPFTVIAGSAFAVDFNPVADRLRVVSDSGQSLRINVDTGATTTDGSINRAGALPVVTAGAYTNSIVGPATTQLFVLDTDSNSLALQNPPNDGTLANIGALGVDLAGDAGFDIAGGANGLVLASMRASGSGPATLYRVDLVTGAALPVNGAANAALSVLGGGTVNVVDIAIAIK